MKEKNSNIVLHFDPDVPCCDSSAMHDLFPDVTRIKSNAENRGRVASIFVESIGIGTQSKALTIDEEEWGRCVTHPNFSACYRLSMAKLELQRALEML